MLTALRQTLTQQALNALIIPTADPHLSEYIPEPIFFRLHRLGRRASGAAR